MNVYNAWDKGFTGSGITIAILDDGLDTDHPDMADNYVRLDFSLGYVCVFVILMINFNVSARFTNLSWVLHQLHVVNITVGLINEKADEFHQKTEIFINAYMYQFKQAYFSPKDQREWLIIT